MQQVIEEKTERVHAITACASDGSKCGVDSTPFWVLKLIIRLLLRNSQPPDAH